MRDCTYTTKTFTFSDFIIIIPDKTTINVLSWHQMDTHVVLDTRLVLEVLRYLLFTVTLEFAILRVLIDILLTVDHMATSVY